MNKEITETKTCPPEHIMNSYLTGMLKGSEYENIERHIADCPQCIYRIAEATKVIEKSNSYNYTEDFMGGKYKINIWLALCITMFMLSFLFPYYFIQFIAAAILFGVKWIVDNKNTKMLIMIYDAWKKGGEKDAGHIIETLEKRMKR